MPMTEQYRRGRAAAPSVLQPAAPAGVAPNPVP